jgi:hypothetical protein
LGLLVFENTRKQISDINRSLPSYTFTVKETTWEELKGTIDGDGMRESELKMEKALYVSNLLNLTERFSNSIEPIREKEARCEPRYLTYGYFKSIRRSNSSIGLKLLVR